LSQLQPGRLTMNHRDESNYIGGPRLLTLRRRPRTNLFDHESNGAERAKGSTSSRSTLMRAGLAPVSSSESSTTASTKAMEPEPWSRNLSLGLPMDRYQVRFRVAVSGNASTRFWHYLRDYISEPSSLPLLGKSLAFPIFLELDERPPALAEEERKA
jgi:hypothetical protein